MEKFESIISQLEIEKAKLEYDIMMATNKLKEIKRQISELKRETVDWASLSIKCLREYDQPLTTTQILMTVTLIQDDLSNPIRRREHVMSLSLRLNRLVQSGKLFKRQEPGLKGHVYGLIEWQDGGELKPHYYHLLRSNVEFIKNKQNTVVNMINDRFSNWRNY